MIVKSFINRFAKSKKRIRLLDIGAGSGSLKKIIDKKILYTGTDVHKNKNVVYHNVTIFNKRFRNKFDFLICLKTIYYVGDKIYTVLKNLKSYVKKNGFIIISYNLKKNSFSNKYLTDLKLRHLLIKNFKEIFTIEINRELYEKNSKHEKLTLFIFQK
jgi:2-polyprenyl-3-methyl-5-hydroxy-6-metoxy-1,4-benzoquinol methylase